MLSDADIKIVGEHPSEDVKRYRRAEAEGDILRPQAVSAARKLGEIIAERLINEAKAENDDIKDYGLIIQRHTLLGFAATVAMESEIENEVIAALAQKSFLDELKRRDSHLYNAASDMGAFSFYYLAYRRGTEVYRRIGQTFAMLCSHDGDPIFQELGEALYCWFFSEIKKIIAGSSK